MEGKIYSHSCETKSWPNLIVINALAPEFPRVNDATICKPNSKMIKTLIIAKMTDALS